MNRNRFSNRCRLLASAGILTAFSLPGFVWADNISGTCNAINPLQTVNDPSNTCYTVTPPPVDETAIVINGVLDPGEWGNAVVKSFGGMGTPSGTVRLLRSTDSIYIAITATIGGQNPEADWIRVYIDPAHSDATSIENDELQFSVNRDNAAPDLIKRNIGTGNIEPWLTNCGAEVNGSQVCTLGGTPWLLEAKLASADFGLDSGLPNVPAIIGIAVEIWDQEGLAPLRSTWPGSGFNQANPSTWANLKTRLPISYQLVLDYSSSMDETLPALNLTKLQAAHRATDYLANFMVALADTTYFPDRLGAVGFSGILPESDHTSVISPLAPVPAEFLHYSSTFTDIPNTRTPIASGLNLGFSELDVDNIGEQQNVIMLLSDGLHNEEFNEFSVVESENHRADILDYRPCLRDLTAQWENPCEQSNVVVNAVHFDQNGILGDGFGRLQDLATYYRGNPALDAADYSITDNLSELKTIFLNTLDELYQLNLIVERTDDLSDNFPVEAGNAKLIAFLGWNDLTNVPDDATFSLLHDGLPHPCDEGNLIEAIGLGICVINNPPGGTWSIANASQPGTADDFFVFADLILRADYSFGSEVSRTGDVLPIYVDLNYGGMPLTDSAEHPLTVTVEVTVPSRGAGDFIASVDADCADTSHATTEGVPVTTNALTDNLLFNRTTACETAGRLSEIPQRNALATITLNDLGMDGDAVAGDGRFSALLTQVNHAGNYTFRFNVEGTTPNNEPFTRTKSVTRYVQTKIDLSRSLVNSRVLSQENGVRREEFFFLPQDAEGNLFGPVNSSMIDFEVIGAQTVSPLTLYQNGLYGITVEYPATGPRPGVVPAAQGTFGSLCEYGYYTSWNAGFVGYIRITNHGSEPINGWEVTWEYSNSQRIFHGWKAGFQGDNPYTATNLDYNAVILPGETTEIGFEGTKDLNSPVETPLVGGAACQPAP